MSPQTVRLADVFEDLLRRAAVTLAPDVEAALRSCRDAASDETARGVLDSILERAEAAKAAHKVLTSDPGVVTFFVRAGCSFSGFGRIEAACRDAVRRVTKAGFLTDQAVGLVDRKASGGNTGLGVPAIHWETVPGRDDCEVTVLLKGAGSDALTTLWMVEPSTTFEELGERIAGLVRDAGGRPCPPLIVGVGLGGTPESALTMSRHALLRPIGTPPPRAELAPWEQAWRESIDATGIGPMGLGGDPTVLAVHVQGHDRHRALFPVAVSLACWSDRRAWVRLDRDGDAVAHGAASES